MALNPSKHRANDLLDRILSAEAASLAEVAEALMVSPATNLIVARICPRRLYPCRANFRVRSMANAARSACRSIGIASPDR